MKYSDDCKVYRIRYYNVWFYLFAKTELDEYKINILGERLGMGDSMMMKDMANGTRTLAFQVSEEFFQRLKKYLKKTGQSQKEFVIGLIEDVLSQEEHVVSGEMQETEGKAELEETE